MRNDPNRWIKDEYNNPAVIVTENGWSDDGEMNDDGRIEYLREHLKQILDVVLNDECDLKAYTGDCKSFSASLSFYSISIDFSVVHNR